MTIRTKEDYIDLLDLAHKLSDGETISFEGKEYAMDKVAPNLICKDCPLYEECTVGLSLICMFVDDILYDRTISEKTEFAKCRLKKYHKTPNK